MREFAKVSPQIWINDAGRQIKKLGLEARVVSLYLETNPYANMIGIYYLPIVLVSHEVGLSVEQSTHAINELISINYCSYDYESEHVWVHDMAKDQIGFSLKQNDNRVKAIQSTVDLLPSLPFMNKFLERYADSFCIQCDYPSETLRSKEKKKEKDNEKENKTNDSLSGKPDTLDEKDILPCKKQIKAEAKQVLDFLNEKTGRGYRDADSNLKLVIARLSSGVTTDECRSVIARKCRDWKGTDMEQYLRPATLFNATKFEQYLGECVVVSDEEVGEHGEK